MPSAHLGEGEPSRDLNEAHVKKPGIIGGALATGAAVIGMPHLVK